MIKLNLLAVLEGILFVVGDEGIDLKQICEVMEINEEKAKECLKELKASYEKDDRGIRISYLGNAFKLTTKKEHKEYYKRLITIPESNSLSAPALETLAIVAYNQPITRLEVDELRGVSTSQMIRKLVAKGLIKAAGKSDSLGRPNLYRTTSEFLDYFGMSTLDDLPEVSLTSESSNDKELFTSIYKEE